MRTAKELEPARGRHPARSGFRIVKVALALAAGLLVTAGLTMTPARAATAGAPESAAIGKVVPDTLGTCAIGENNSYEYHTSCGGTGPTSYRAIAICADGEGVFGLERWDGDTRQSYASCEVDDLGSTLSTQQPDWGILLCTNNDGDGTYQGYLDRHGDISWILLNWGNGNIMTGGTTLCDYNTTGEAPFNPNEAP
jgi:hypothetical protein